MPIDHEGSARMQVDELQRKTAKVYSKNMQIKEKRLTYVGYKEEYSKIFLK